MGMRVECLCCGPNPIIFHSRALLRFRTCLPWPPLLDTPCYTVCNRSDSINLQVGVQKHFLLVAGTPNTPDLTATDLCTASSSIDVLIPVEFRGTGLTKDVVRITDDVAADDCKVSSITNRTATATQPAGQQLIFNCSGIDRPLNHTVPFMLNNSDCE